MSTTMSPERKSGSVHGGRAVLRFLAATLFVVAGLNHFRSPAIYRQIIPPEYPAPAMLVAVSGACEVIGGLGLLLPRLRRWAGWGLIALLVAVFPANVFMAMHPESARGVRLPHWTLWARLPLQPVLMAWVWVVALSGNRRASTRPLIDARPP